MVFRFGRLLQVFAAGGVAVLVAFGLFHWVRRSAPAQTVPRQAFYQCGTQPTILVYHTHASETYRGGGSIVDAGQALSSELCARGFAVIHLPFVFDQPGTEGAYQRARPVLKKMLRNQPGIQYLFDVHRDAPDPVVDEPKRAGVLLVVGHDNKTLDDDLSFAKEVNLELIRQHSSLNRGIRHKNASYNQDLPPSALLIEVGKANNTVEQAVDTVLKLADVLAVVLDRRSDESGRSMSR